MIINWFMVGKWAVISLLALGVGWKGYDLVADHFAGIKDVQTKLSNERIERERAQVALAVLRSTVIMEDQHEIVVKELRDEYQAELVSMRKAAQEQTAVLDDRARLKRLAIAKGEKMAKLSNNATKDRFDELETIYNN